MTKLSIIIVNYNTKDLLINLLDSLKKAISVCAENKFEIQIIVVDNNSQDKSVSAIKSRFNWVEIIQNKENLGFSKANNAGILDSKGELVLLLNSDTVVFPQTLYKIIKFMDDNPLAGAMTCWVELSKGNIDPASHRGFPTPWNAFCYFSGLEKIFSKSKLFSGYHQGWKNLKETHQIDACSGAFLLTRKEVISKIGFLDEDFFMYGEDIDFCFRVKKAGFNILYYPNTKIIHYKGQSGRKKTSNNEIGNDVSKEIKKTSKLNFYGTMKLFYEKHYKDKYPCLIFWLVLSGIWLVSKVRK